MNGRVNVPIMLASLTLSVMLWLVVYVQNLPAPDTITVPLVVQGLNDSRQFVTRIDSSMRLRVQGPEEKIRNVRDDRPTAYVDLSNAHTGHGLYPVQVVPTTLRNYLIDAPLMTKVDIEPMVQRTLGIQIMGRGTLRDPTFTLEKPRFSPRQAIVQGPRSEVERVVEIRAYLDLAGIDPLNVEPQSQSLIPLDATGTEPSHVRVVPAQVVISPSIDATPFAKTVVVAPVFVGQPATGYLPNGYRSNPQEIALSGANLVLAGVSKVYTEPINVWGIRKDTTFRAKLRLPKGTQTNEPTVSVVFLVRAQSMGRAKKTPPAEFPTTVPPISTGGTP